MSSEATNPVYVVFGATGGVGAELARRLATRQEGSTVILAARDEAKLEKLRSDVGGESEVVDILHHDQVAALMSKIAEKHGRVTGVANCVGSMLLKPAHITSEAEFRNQIEINLVSAFNIVKGSVKAMMKSGGGSIALCSSAVADHGYANHEAVAAAKGGVTGLAKSAAATYAPHNIRVNVVSPGLIAGTNMTSRISGSEAALKASKGMHALGRVGQPRDVASALEFLLYPENDFITGAVLNVDGGLGNAAPVKQR
ncbi:hypothetical protein WJX72_005658 [[Myrmecia] bisecta]|uniref:Ketoreductase domain-containing protein n=1 Tax=[Myrmecia] bisecta TaxID=41462 RepID=A0AAW1PSE0_9CHLO